jgi:hypothetical protein
VRLTLTQRESQFFIEHVTLPRRNRKKSYEAETENTQSHGQAGLSYRRRQIYAPQGRNKPLAAQQVARGNPFDGQKVSTGYQRYTPDKTLTALLFIGFGMHEIEWRN